MNGPMARYLDGSETGRLHLQYGPIDLIIGVDGPRATPKHIRHAQQCAWNRFQTILPELVDELPLLRSPATPHEPGARGSTARRMVEAVRPFAANYFITPMAAVAGAVADEVLAAIRLGFSPDDCPERIFVNNGGDIAFHLSGEVEFSVGIAQDDGEGLGRFRVTASEPMRGIATSGRGGRSLSLGIADSVTALADDAASADAAATIIANAVDLPGHPSIRRAPASSVKDDSDLGDLPVVIDVAPLPADEIARALDRGQEMAEHLIDRGLISRAALFLQGAHRIAAPHPAPFPMTARLEMRPHA
ncbi:UPF0280 family protein [Rhizobium sp. SL86]|uniref:UPF0280 family protein n=1 Tax=Rhizobium sp. SL86 TaxID=2995148 RepID=UPI002272837A|nr:UPF0280 family protein [Rhizobium sp. SL86]MCY1666825.1 UPF0280 family protein [Rhizobium sp. SL86]